MSTTKRVLTATVVLATAGVLISASAGPIQGAERIVPPGAQVEKLAGGFRFTEGPAWDRRQAVYFSDIPNKTIHRWTKKGGVTVYRTLPGSCNGLRFDGAGNLYVCQPVGRRLIRITRAGKIEVIADRFQGKRLNSPNDLWIDPRGGVYFTDPRYGSMEGLEQDGFHVYYVPPGGKALRRVIDDLKKPNGVIGSADGKKLYVADHGGNTTYVYDIAADGSLKNRRVAAPVGSDGLALDERGNIYVTGRSIRAYSPNGTVVAEIPLPEVAANMTFGGTDGRTLFITARTGFYAIRLNARDGSDPFASY